jgi:hypothetical protein
MGLTHYWLRPIELPAVPFAQASDDIQAVVKASGLPLAGFEGVGTIRESARSALPIPGRG